jgi:phosphonate transport system permease protein
MTAIPDTAARRPASLGDIRADYLAQTRRRQMYTGILLVVFVAMFASGFRVAEQRNAGSFADGFARVLDFPAELISEAWSKAGNLPGHALRALPALIETVNIALMATLVGCLFGTLLALAGTRGLARWPRFIGLARRTSDVFRAVPEIVVALVLIFVMGGGPVPAMVAIAIHTAGAMGKLLSEVNENVDLKPVEGLASVGANWWQRTWLGVFPQVMPNYVSYGLLRLEINIRASAILGFVGAGGIGYELKNAMTFGQGKFDEAAAIFLILFATIVIVDQISSAMRNRLTHGDAR